MDRGVASRNVKAGSVAANADRLYHLSNFANPNVHVQSWYVVARSPRIKRGRAYSIDLLGRTVVCYRGESGAIYVADAFCPHLGSNLALGKVEEESIRCAFHGWCFSANGCEGGKEKAQLHYYPVVERYGLVWMFNGPVPLFELPALESCGHAVRLPPQTIRCHPHIVLANGLDLEHFEVMHGMDFSSRPALSQPNQFEISIELSAKPRSKMLRTLLGVRKADIRATSFTVGASIAVIKVHAPDPVTAMFSGRCNAEGHCVTQTVLFMPSLSPMKLSRNLLLLMTMLHADRRILDNIRFTPGFVRTDAPMKLYYDAINTAQTG